MRAFEFNATGIKQNGAHKFRMGPLLSKHDWPSHFLYPSWMAPVSNRTFQSNLLILPLDK